MQRVHFLFGISLGYEVLRHTDNLSKTLQHTDMSAAEGQGLAKLKLDILENLLQEKPMMHFGIKLWDCQTPLMSMNLHVHVTEKCQSASKVEMLLPSTQQQKRICIGRFITKLLIIPSFVLGTDSTSQDIEHTVIFKT